MTKTVEVNHDLRFFWQQERRTEERLRNYLTGPRCKVSPKPVLADLQDRQAKYLPANNPKARRDFGSAAARHFGATLDQIEGPVYFLTFAFENDACRLENASEFEGLSIQSRVREILRGCNFIGMVEVALYGNFRRKDTEIPRRILSWHTHALLWGLKKRQLRRLIADVRARYRSLLKGMPSADWRTVRRGEEVRTLLYSLKAPAWGYRTYLKSDDDARSREGRLVGDSPESKYRQRTQSLRPGDQVRVHNALKDRYLDKLAFAGGEGVPLLEAIRYDALKHYRREEERRAVRRSHSASRRRSRRKPA